MAKVNIADFFSEAIRQDAKEQIEYITMDRIDPDPKNFYSLEGLDELAANIELIGLQQPLRVRPGEGDHFIIVSGHRRRAAIIKIMADGSHQFDDGVPCIVERAPASDAMRELRLIYANAATRILSPAEISKQAERVEMLLYKLKEEEKIEFPGRMRVYVAAACKVSKSKLARLHAIRKNLAPDILENYFDKDEISEATAYALSQKDHDLQRWILDNYRAHHKDSNLPEWWVRDFSSDAEAMDSMKCKQASGAPCIHKRAHVEKMWRLGYHSYEGCIRGSVARCCYDCDNLASCSVSCERCAEKKKRVKADAAAKRRSERETKAADEANRREQEELEISQAGLYWARLGGALKDAGIDFWTLQDSLKHDRNELTGKHARKLCSFYLGTDDIEALLDGRPAKNDDAAIPTPFYRDQGVQAAQDYAKIADMLGVSIDYLLLHSDNPKPVSELNTGLQWQTGTPETPGDYVIIYGVSNEETEATRAETISRWDGELWISPRTGTQWMNGMTVYRWVKLPEV